mmetsp:Transcript_80417/g.146627  ORF Transcript_80417/g.146627 Transcript_80417/m.146627 type:complete len:235 (+) Transcript_80417:883-1587(+)
MGCMQAKRRRKAISNQSHSSCPSDIGWPAKALISSQMCSASLSSFSERVQKPWSNELSLLARLFGAQNPASVGTRTSWPITIAWWTDLPGKLPASSLKPRPNPSFSGSLGVDNSSGTSSSSGLSSMNSVTTADSSLTHVRKQGLPRRVSGRHNDTLPWFCLLPAASKLCEYDDCSSSCRPMKFEKVHSRSHSRAAFRFAARAVAICVCYPPSCAQHVSSVGGVGHSIGRSTIST